MAKGFKHGAGGGASLSFKVVGNPQPENPKENTIWVDTDAKITGWNFNATQPDSPQEGVLWIRTGSYSNAAFNALKKNNISVYPLSAKQYVSGAWTDKTAKVYLGGGWTSLRSGVLYDRGDQCEADTGGWIKRYGNSFALNADHMLLKAVTGESTGASTQLKVDTTGYSRLCFEFSCKVSTAGALYLGLCSAVSDITEPSKWIAYVNHAYTQSTETYTFTVPVENAQGAYYIALRTSSTSGLYVYKVWLE